MVIDIDKFQFVGQAATDSCLQTVEICGKI